MKWKFALLAAFTASILFLLPALAQQRGHRPPQEAFDACDGLEEGAACEVETPRGDTLQGTCRSMGEEALVCVPKNHRPGRGGPPRR